MDFSKIKSATKIALYRLTPAKLRARVKLSMIDFVQTPPILVYQMGKVGSTSILHTLSGMDLGRPVYQAHYLSDEGIREAKRWNRRVGRKVPASVGWFQLLGRKVRRNLGKAHYTVITGVRDPIAREISELFERGDKIDLGLRDEGGSYDIDSVLSYLLDSFRRFDGAEHRFFSTAWLDRELKGTFGIDVYGYPFDHEKGYEIVRYEGLDLLVYQYEQLANVWADAMGELLGLDKTHIPSLNRDNVGKAKWYADAYAEVKNSIIVPVDVCRKLYSVKHVRHFYSDQTISRWIEHWSGPREL